MKYLLLGPGFAADYFSNDKCDFETKRTQKAVKTTLKTLLVVTRDI